MVALRELLRGMGEINMSLGEAILACNRTDLELKGEFMGDFLETTKAVTRALLLELTEAITKLGENAQKAKELVDVPGSSCGVAAFCLTTGYSGETDGGVTAGGVTAGTMTDSSGGPRSLLDPVPGATAAAQALNALKIAEGLESNAIESWRVDEALKELWESQRLASESAMCAWKALVIIDNFKNPDRVEGKKDEDQPDVPIKSAKRAMRDVYIWRCMGLVLGMDSLLALNPIFDGAGETRPQLIQCFVKIRQSTANMLTGKSVAVTPPEGSHAKRVRGRKEDRSCGVATHTELAPPPGLSLPDCEVAVRGCSEVATLVTEALTDILPRYSVPCSVPCSVPDDFAWMQ